MKNPQSGNVLFYILIAVALLAALSYAVSQSGRGSIGQVTEEKAKILGTEIIEYGNAIANATAQLRLRGVKDSSLCYDDAHWGGANYNHAGCADDAAKIFHTAGGGVTWKNAPAEAMNSAATPDNLWHIYGDNEIKEVGTTCGADSCADLILVVDELNKTVCMKINKLLSVTEDNVDPPTDSGMGTTRYIGVYGYAQTIGDEGSTLVGKSAACFENTGTGEYTFYKVLVAR
ncbi:MAG: hypothetical protein IT558_03580 [Alphaproteobacteria bacterium]|nr:hypothetical protein [Alphaproteobacteria bacterium]